MRFASKLLGFDSQYSWMKWLRMSFAAVALFIAGAFWSNFGPMVMDGGIIGVILALVIFAVLFGPILLAMMGVAALIGFLVGGMRSGIRQRESIRETAATGSAELMAVEKLRMKSQLLDFLFILAGIALLVLGGVFALPLAEAFGEAGIYGYIIVAVVLLVAFYLAKAPARARYRTAFKEGIVKKGLEALLNDMVFRPGETLDEALVQAAELFPPYDGYSGNDFLSAAYHGHRFVQSDVHLTERQEETYRDRQGNLRTRSVDVTVFRGRMMVFDYDAISNEPVTVYDHHGRRFSNAQTVQTELDAFNRQFVIVAANPTAALRILTPPVLEGIVLARGKVGCPLHFSFRSDKLFVALANGDAFEAAGGDATLLEQRRRVADDIQAMLDLVDTLYLKKE